MSTIAELAVGLGLAPMSDANPGAYVAYLASLIIEFGAGASLFVVVGLRLGRGLGLWIRGWSIAPEQVFKLVIPVACLLTSAGLLAMDVR